ncbi:MAG: chemotaxis protein CheW [Treponemataceae bacterium]
MDQKENEKLDGQYLSFNLGDERYAVAVSSVEVVLEMAAITRVPRCPPHLRGVINHRGSVVPVVDLRAVFGREPTKLEAGSAVIVTQVEYEGEFLTAGVLADEVQEVLDLDDSDIERAPSFGSRIDGSFVKGIGRHGEGFVILLDLEKALSGTVSGDSSGRPE